MSAMDRLWRDHRAYGVSNDCAFNRRYQFDAGGTVRDWLLTSLGALAGV